MKEYIRALCVTASLTVSALNSYQLIKIMTERFSTKAYTKNIEANVYRLIAQQEGTSNIQYVAAPWTWLLNTGELYKLQLPNQNNASDDVLRCTVSIHEGYLQLIPTLQRLGVQFLFSPHVCRETRCGLVTVVPFPHGAPNADKYDPEIPKTIFASFVGTYTHPIRKAMYDSLCKVKRDDIFLIQRNKYHGAYSAQIKEQHAQEYKKILLRSRFSLCPRGFAAATGRFWESLKSGSIPVVIGADQWKPPVSELEWDKAIIHIPESEVDTILERLENISPEEEQAMRERCIALFDALHGENLLRTIEMRFNITRK